MKLSALELSALELSALELSALELSALELSRQLTHSIPVEENSGLGKAIRYFIKHYVGLSYFCPIEGVKIDNNAMSRYALVSSRFFQ